MQKYTPVSSEISDFMPCAHAQNDILYIVLSRFWVLKWCPKILQWPPKFLDGKPRRKITFFWIWIKSINFRGENGVDTPKLHHDTLSKTLKKHCSIYKICWENWWLGFRVQCLGKCVGLGFVTIRKRKTIEI